MTTAEVAAFLGCCTKTVYLMVADGRLEAVRFSKRGRLRFRREAIEAMLEAGSK